MTQQIYTVTTLSDLTHSRCVGFFYDINDALEVLKTNACDIYEGDQDYAVLELFSPGLYPTGKIIDYYEYDEEKDGYVKCDMPKGFDYIVNFALG